ncbi:CRISPR-associated helicase Cas3' [Mangrovihabitans endophyticus]|uniref:CRISPR-associated helicase/endonuclease Cas3 n=1 Tax=Mangrovihabitans endophyticus TaxID=1751298 RepID=A0A8J3C5F1_9ACTN|nr:CRISPR-associated helicase Cas3' [Mangrovihabitans endophyticus]GGL20508.1 CRISPR-associated helicase/endonuclease Cas3 [Mangrovihabitans endophyticus]
MNSAVGLSDAARVVWGKSGDLVTPLPLWRHMADSADVAGRLWDEWLPRSVRDRIACELPLGSDDGRRLVRWVAGVHDIGKATPAFAGQVPHLAGRMQDFGFVFDQRVAADRRAAPHATAGFIVLCDWLIAVHGWDPSSAAMFAAAIGGHHGIPPTDGEIQVVRERQFLLGVEGLWPGVRAELLAWMAHRAGVAERLAAWGDVVLTRPVQVLLTGVVIVADWIASNEELFPYHFMASDEERLAAGWESLDLPAPWRAVRQDLPAEELFARRFSLPEGASPYPVQSSVLEVARAMPVPGLLIAEAPMGEGKTEAALAAVEVLAARNGAGGCFLALPTRATSDAMFSRALEWVSRLPDADVGRGAYGVALAHGKASLNTEFSELFRRSLPSQIGCDEGGAETSAHRWMAGRKRPMLSNFVIGTVDQLLFAALKARHVALRHLGLTSKVVVIDEAHAYDVYMSQYLDRALEWLAAHGVTVVVLSATLPAGRRADMIKAYDDGRFAGQNLGAIQPRRWAVPAVAADPYRDLRAEARYPLVTVSAEERGGRAVGCAISGRGAQVLVERHDDDVEALAATLRAALAEGGCALVVRNTVRRVLATADRLRELLGSDIPVSVTHSRFMGPDRAAKDRWLLNTFGSPRQVREAGGSRPQRHIVVSSQVAEQSLDIDFDVLVTDLAPVDLVLQRIGRLHRHLRSERPASLASPRCLITGADWAATPPEPVSGSRRVYGRSALLRAAAVLWPHLVEGVPVGIPADISPLVQAAYGEDLPGPVEWRPVLAEAEQQRAESDSERVRRAGTFRLGPVGSPGDDLTSWLHAGVGDAESAGDDARGRAHVRDDGPPTLEVLVVVRTPDGWQIPPWIDNRGGQILPVDAQPPRGLDRALASCTLSLPAELAAEHVIDRVLAELEARTYIEAWQKNPWLAGELILDLDPDGRTCLAGFNIEYDAIDGLRISKADS